MVERSVRFIGDEVAEEDMPFEGEMEDFEEPEDDEQANDNFIPTKNNGHQLQTTTPEPITKEVIPVIPRQPLQQLSLAPDDEGGHGKRVWKESAYVCHIQEGENATIIPRGFQTVPEKAVEDTSVQGEHRRGGLGNGDGDGYSGVLESNLWRGKGTFWLAKVEGGYPSWTSKSWIQQNMVNCRMPKGHKCGFLKMGSMN